MTCAFGPELVCIESALSRVYRDHGPDVTRRALRLTRDACRWARPPVAFEQRRHDGRQPRVVRLGNDGYSRVAQPRDINGLGADADSGAE